MVSSPPDLDALPSAELKALVVALLERVTVLERTLTAQRDEIARLKVGSSRPTLKPSGMENATETKPPDGKGRSHRGGAKTDRRVIHEDKVIEAAVPAGARFKGYEDFVVQDLVLRPHVVRYRRERWVTLDGQTITAALPAGVRGHFGADLHRFVLAHHLQGQVTVARLLVQLQAIGIDISKRQVTRLLIAGQDGFIDEARDVLRAGLTSAWLS